MTVAISLYKEEYKSFNKCVHIIYKALRCTSICLLCNCNAM